ncbi:MAG: flagellar hook-associated protein 3 [Gammaproteobacteria bacterium]|nr:MAG: flagellar hook-associated protein 3 [Gammaproteobacteria bacterium]
MRISTSYLFDQNLSAMLNQQVALSKTQLQISTGKRILSPSDDPSASVQILSLQREVSVTEQYLVNADKAENKLAIEEGTLQGATDTLQRIRELAVQGLNDSNTQADRQAIAAEILQLNEQLMAIANTRDSNGDYLFSGFKSNTQPYDNINGTYQGDEGQRNLKVGAGVLIETNDPGSKIFAADVIATTVTAAGAGTLEITGSSGVADTFPAITFTFQAGNQYQVNYASTPPVTASFNYTDGEEVDLSSLDSGFPTLKVKLSGTPANGDTVVVEKLVTQNNQSTFTTIHDFANALANNNVGANNSPNNGDFLTNISASLGRVIDTQAKVGARLNAIDLQREVNDSLSFNMQKTLSEVQDLDYAEAISRLALQEAGLQAAQQTFVRVQGLSLFNFL